MTDKGDYYMNKLAVPDMGRSTLFPTFNVNVPMPSGTAVPAAAPAAAASGQAGGSSAAAAPARATQPSS